MKAEIWKAVPVAGFEQMYQVSDRGRVRSLDRVTICNGRDGMKMRFKGRVLRQHPNHEGYLAVPIKGNGIARTIAVHRLVIRAFRGEAPDKQTNHRDGNKANNRLDNLEYCTSAQNLRHCIDVLKKKRGTAFPQSKLKDSQIPDIRADRRKLKEIAADYGVSTTVISQVRSRKLWAHVP